jgi:hypothetical protein
MLGSLHPPGKESSVTIVKGSEWDPVSAWKGTRVGVDVLVKNKNLASIRIGISNFRIYRLVTPQTTQSYGDNNEMRNTAVCLGTRVPSPLSKVMPTFLK